MGFPIEIFLDDYRRKGGDHKCCGLGHDNGQVSYVDRTCPSCPIFSAVPIVSSSPGLGRFHRFPTEEADCCICILRAASALSDRAQVSMFCHLAPTGGLFACAGVAWLGMGLGVLVGRVGGVKLTLDEYDPGGESMSCFAGVVCFFAMAAFISRSRA